MVRIIELIPGRDGKIRTVKLKTQHGTVLRPVQRVYPLEIRANEDCVTEEVADPGFEDFMQISRTIARSTAVVFTNHFNGQATFYLWASRIIRERSASVIGLDKFLEESRGSVPNSPKMVTNMIARLVTRNDANLTLSSGFRHVPIELPL
ncbi:hypothetical protein TNCV_818631 [Trichonephila clavipes]|nr:hypothetical protein TNCV_818631 [Trichonephila clavipes]